MVTSTKPHPFLILSDEVFLPPLNPHSIPSAPQITPTFYCRTVLHLDRISQTSP